MNSEDYIEILREKRRIRKIRFIVILISILSLVLFYWISFKTDFFHIDNIEISGNKILDNNIIIEKANINIGDNLLKIKKNNIIKNLSQISYIESIEIEKRYPKELKIIVSERVPVMQIKLDNKSQLLDPYGYVLENIEIENDMPQIINLLKKEMDINQNIYKSLDNDEFYDFFITLHDLNLLNKMHIINFENNKNIVLTTKEGIVIDFGPLHGVEYKVKLLNEVMTDLRDKGVPYKKIIMNRGSNPIIITQD